MNSAQRTFWVQALHIFVLSGFAFAQPLYDIIGQYPTYLVAHKVGPKELVLLVLLLSIGLPLVPLALEGLAELIYKPLRRWIHMVVVFSLFGLILLPPLAKLGIENGIWLFAISIVLAVAITLIYFAARSFRTLVTILSPVIIVFPLLFLFTKPVITLLAPRDDSAPETISLTSTPPIVMVVFDEFSSVSIMDDNREIDADRFPELAKFSRGAYWFRNATTNADMTSLALPAIVTGLMPSKAEGVIPTHQYYPNNLFTLLEGKYRMNAIEPATSLCPGSGSDTSRLRPFLSLLIDTGIVYLHLVLPASVAKGLPTVSQNWAGFLQNQDSASLKWANVQSILDERDRAEKFREFVSSIQDSSQPTLNFLHVLLPHVPYEYLPSGKKYKRVIFRSPRGEVPDMWGNDELGTLTYYQRYLLQVGFVDRLIGELVQRLKALNLYDDALIIFVGDHGVSILPGEHRRILTERNYTEILPIPLFIKIPHQSLGVIDDRNVESIDILPMIAEVVGAKADWNFDGTSFLDLSTEGRPQKEVHTSDGEVHYFSAEFPEKYDALQRKLDLFGVGRNPLDLYRLGPNKQLVGRHLDELEIADSSTFRIRVHEAGMLGDLDVGQPTLPTAISGLILSNTNQEGDRNVAIAVNDVILAVTKTFMHGTQECFAALIPETALHDGANRVEAFAVEKRDNNTFRLLRSGHLAPERMERRAKRHG